MAIIGFIIIFLFGLFLLYLAGVVMFCGAAFGGGGGWESLIPLVLGILTIWSAFHYGPFTITFTGG